MKRALPFLFFACALFSEETGSYWSFHPLQVGGHYIGLGKADITDTPLKGNLQFTKANTYAEILVPVTPKTYFFPRAEWTTFTMDWNKNPKFNTTRFYYAQASLTFYSTDMKDWRWVSRIQYNFDTKHFDEPGRYGLFSGLLWGSYHFHHKWHFHTGALGYSGLEGGQFYPVVGFDYSPTKKWTILAVFPIEYYIQYKFNENWHLAAKARPLKERFRADKDQPQPESVFSYSTTGVELNLHYEIFRRLVAEIYGGYNVGGTFYIKNKTGGKALYTDVGGSPYGGVTLSVGI